MGVRNEANRDMGHEESRNERYLSNAADIPDLRSPSSLSEYRDFTEDQIWTPQEAVNEWLPLYVFMARSVLTFVQETKGIPNREAMENSCTGCAEQYVTDVLHDSEYVPEVALRRLMTKELPEKIVSRWTGGDIELFVQGIARHGKNFAMIQKDLLPGKTTKDVVDFYYAWKWSESAKELRGCHRRRRTKRRFPSIRHVFQLSPKIVTRSATRERPQESSERENTFLLKRKRRSSLGR